ncbi:MAG: class II aldolase/adducin family protein [Bryobacteraceae bacterium]
MHDAPLAYPSELLPIKRCSELWGSDRLLTQGAGGNTSLKLSDWMWIKASGTWLADAGKDDIFVPVETRSALAAIERGDDDKAVWRTPDGRLLRSSIETSLHAVIPLPWVVHLHTLHSMFWASVEEPIKYLTPLLEGLPWGWVEYARPGLPLTLALKRCHENRQRVWVLGNHGLVVAGDGAEEVSEWLYEVERRLVTEAVAGTFDPERLTASCPAGYHTAKYADSHLCAILRETFEQASAGMPAPDFAVFLGARLCPIEERSAYETEQRHAPPVLLIRGAGALVRDGVSENGEQMLEAFGRMLSRLNGRRLTFLPKDEVAALLDWDAEKYRQSLNRS